MREAENYYNEHPQANTNPTLLAKHFIKTRETQWRQTCPIVKVINNSASAEEVKTNFLATK